MRPDQQVQAFVNAPYPWRYYQDFVVVLTNDADRSHVPPCVKFERNAATITGGEVFVPLDSDRIEMKCSDGKDFSWPVAQVRHIESLKGQLLWVNYAYR